MQTVVFLRLHTWSANLRCCIWKYTGTGQDRLLLKQQLILTILITSPNTKFIYVWYTWPINIRETYQTNVSKYSWHLCNSKGLVGYKYYELQAVRYVSNNDSMDQTDLATISSAYHRLLEKNTGVIKIWISAQLSTNISRNIDQGNVGRSYLFIWPIFIQANADCHNLRCWQNPKLFN